MLYEVSTFTLLGYIVSFVAGVLSIYAIIDEISSNIKPNLHRKTRKEKEASRKLTLGCVTCAFIAVILFWIGGYR